MLYFVTISYSAAHFDRKKKATAYVAAETPHEAHHNAVAEFRSVVGEGSSAPFILDVDVAACKGPAVFTRQLSA